MIDYFIQNVPEGWVSCNMKDISQIVGGSTPSTTDPSNFDDNGIPWITPADLSNFKEKYVNRGKRSISKKGLDSSSVRLLPKNTVLMSSRAPIGYLAIAANEICTNQGFKNFICNSDVNPEYVYYWLMCNQESLQEMGSGTTFKEISGAKAKEIPVIYPPLEEQQRIVIKIEELLARVESAKERLDRVPAIMQQFRQSVLAAACSGRLTEQWRDANGFDNSNNQNLDIPSYWKQVTVIEICDCIVPNRDKPKSFTGNIPWVTLPDIPQYSFIIDSNSSRLGLSYDEIQQYRARIIPKGSVIMSCVGKFGISVIAGRDLVVNQQFHAFLPSNKILPHYLLYVIRNSINYFENTASATTISYLNKTKCNKMPVPLPPLEEQQEIIHLVNLLYSCADRVEAQVATARSHVETITQSILHQAFTGRLV